MPISFHTPSLSTPLLYPLSLSYSSPILLLPPSFFPPFLPSQLRLLFHGRIHLVTKEMTIILPASTNPYNNVEFLELRLGDLDARLLTNSGCCNFTLNSRSSSSLFNASPLPLSLPSTSSSLLHCSRFSSTPPSLPPSFLIYLYQFHFYPLPPPSSHTPPPLPFPSSFSFPFLLCLLCLFCFHFLLPSSSLSRTQHAWTLRALSS